MAFRKVAIGIVGGGIVGWLAHVETARLTDKTNAPPIDVLSPGYRSTPWNRNWDGRAPATQVTASKTTDANNNNNETTADVKKNSASRHLYFIRHGQYNLGGLTDTDQVLTPLGRDQAAATAKRLADLALPYTVLVHSSMTRARETAEIIRAQLPAGLPVTECDLLREGMPFGPEPPLVGDWKTTYKLFEDGAAPRIEAAFKKHFHRADATQVGDSYEVFVCHANVIRYFVCRALQLPPEAWLRMSLYHASITTFTIRPNGNVTLRTIGDAGHLTQGLLTVS